MSTTEEEVLTAGGGQRCRFLLENNNIKLAQSFCNYVSLGQFELARAMFKQLQQLNSPTALELLDTLVGLGPPAEWLCSVSVPSSSHLSWLCVTLCYESGARNRYPRWLLNMLEFDILVVWRHRRHRHSHWVNRWHRCHGCYWWRRRV